MRCSRAALLMFSLLTATAFAADRPVLYSGSGSMIYGGPAGGPAKAARDSFLLMGPFGSGAPYIGDFEVGYKALDPALANGWTSMDMTVPSTSHWQVSDYFAVSGALSAWCGNLSFPSCGGDDPDGGYGNNWVDMLEWRQTVDDPATNTVLAITATANIHSEPGYDGTTLQVEKLNVGFVDVNYWDGYQAALAISERVTYQPDEYMGPAADEVVVIWHFESDGAYSDHDCSYPSSGGIQLDDVTIISTNGAGTGGVVDFEDGTFGPFDIPHPVGVGDFAKIWSDLDDMDPCESNYSRQVAFIDDGVVVPGTGGTLCQDWCYGPDGFIVNTTGGLAGPESHLHNAILSPVMAWADPTHTGVLFEYGVYLHEDLGPDSPGIFHTWYIRSATSEVGLETAPWENREFVQWGGLGYFRKWNRVDDLVVGNPTHFQIRLEVIELGWVWGWTGDNGTPAPYFDNVRLTTFQVIGPSLVSREIDLANDCFPENGIIDMAAPQDLWCRFDMARNISPPDHLHRDFGDSLVFDCAVTRPGEYRVQGEDQSAVRSVPYGPDALRRSCVLRDRDRPHRCRRAQPVLRGLARHGLAVPR